MALSEIIRRSSGSHNNHLKGRKAKSLSQERIAALEAIEGIPYSMPGVESSTEHKEAGTEKSKSILQTAGKFLPQYLVPVKLFSNHQFLVVH